MPLALDRTQILAYRCAAQHLTVRLPAGRLLEAAAAGLQDASQPPGPAAMALAARVDEVTAETVDRALRQDKTLLVTWSLRGSPYAMPTVDAPHFTTALLPADEGELRAFLAGLGPALDTIGIAGLEVADLVERALYAELQGGPQPFRALSTALTDRVAQELPPAQRELWQGPGWYAPPGDDRQRLGEAVVHFALRIVALRGAWCFVPQGAGDSGGEAVFVRTDQWLGERRVANGDPDEARAGLLRRFLHAYGTGTPAEFAAWAGIAIAAARRAAERLEGVRDDITVSGRSALALAADVPALDGAHAPAGVRLLPPHDPYLAHPARDLLVPDRAVQRRIWRRVGNPGVVLSAGEVVGLWRPKKQGARLTLTVEPLQELSAAQREEIAAEAERIAAVRDVQRVAVAYA